MAGIEFYVPDYGYYLYDGCTNKILCGSKQDHPEIDLNKGIDRIVWRESLETLQKKQEKGLTSLMLQMTRDCNLQCRYCIYSGQFPQMHQHAQDDMSPDTILKSIDFFMSHSDPEEDTLIILFYGGEPLLKFENIQLAVDYSAQFGRKIKYGISSNGMAMKPPVVKWLADHPNVHITITVNGFTHDRYRVTNHGKGSLSMIMENLAYAKNNYSEVWKNQIRFIANAMSLDDLPQLHEFYNDIIGKPPQMVTRISLSGCEEVFAEEMFGDVPKHLGDDSNLWEAYLHSPDPFLEAVYAEGMDQIHNRGICGEDFPGLIGSCMPMSWRLFVRTDGTFNMCEKVTDAISLGDLDHGFDSAMTQKLYKGMYDFANRNCRNCWAQRLCMYCYQDILNADGEIIGKFDSSWCEKSQKSILKNLKRYVCLMQTKPERMEANQDDCLEFDPSSKSINSQS